MSRVNSRTRAFALRLMACEAARNKSSGTDLLTAFSACGRLKTHLAVLIGKAGFHTLLSRVLALSAADAPGLGAVRIGPDGAPERAHELKEREGSTETGDEGMILLAHLLGLLEAFIGEELTVQVVRGIWPELSPEEDELWKKEMKR